MARRAPGDGVALDEQVARPATPRPLARVDQQRTTDPKLPVAAEVPLERRLVNVCANDQIGLMTGNKSGQQPIAVRPGADRRSFGRFVMQDEPRGSSPVAGGRPGLESGSDTAAGVDAVHDGVVAHREDQASIRDAYLLGETRPPHLFDAGCRAHPAGTCRIVVALGHSERTTGRGQAGEAVENGSMLLLERGAFREDFAQVPAKADEVKAVGMADDPREPFPVCVQVGNCENPGKQTYKYC